MGEFKRKQAAAKARNLLGTAGAPVGTQAETPPLGNTGGKRESLLEFQKAEMGTERYRINLTVPDAIHNALISAARQLDLTLAQVTLQAVVAGLGTISTQVDHVRYLHKLERTY
jgi:hypothetical protein